MLQAEAGSRELGIRESEFVASGFSRESSQKEF
jgi:hypothetical protein